MTFKRFPAPISSAIASVVVAGMLSAAGTQITVAAELSGSWSGGGVMNLSSGGQERVRCKVKYFRVSEAVFSMSARCASGAGRLDQTGSLTKTGTDKYQGTVYNPQHGVTATVYVTLHGRRQSVFISSAGGTGSFSLKKR